MKCLLDCDGVLTNFHVSAYAVHGIDDPFLKEENLGCYNLEKVTGISNEKFFKPLGYDFWVNLPKSDEFDDILRMVEERFGPDNICILTAPPCVKTDGCLAGKEDWIYKNLPRYKNQFLIGKPKAFCAGPNSVLIDDHSGNTKAFREAGGKIILVPRAWNPLYTYRAFPALHVRDCLLSIK